MTEFHRSIFKRKYTKGDEVLLGTFLSSVMYQRRREVTLILVPGMTLIQHNVSFLPAADVCSVIQSVRNMKVWFISTVQ
jgi:hypothetical protein